jgi:hypothetical protein
MTDLPTTDMEDWEFTQGFYYGLTQEAKEHIDSLAGATFLSHPVPRKKERSLHTCAQDVQITCTVSYPVPRNRERSLHTCAQDVQITRMATI